MIAAVSIGAWVGSAGLIGLCASSYTGGVVSWWSYASLYLVTLPWIFFFVSRLRSLKLFTIAEFYQKRFPGRNGAIQYLVGGGFAPVSYTHLVLFTRDTHGEDYLSTREGRFPVSYTHLDVYKRQPPFRTLWLNWAG